MERLVFFDKPLDVAHFHSLGFTIFLSVPDESLKKRWGEELFALIQKANELNGLDLVVLCPFAPKPAHADMPPEASGTGGAPAENCDETRRRLRMQAARDADAILCFIPLPRPAPVSDAEKRLYFGDVVAEVTELRQQLRSGHFVLCIEPGVKAWIDRSPAHAALMPLRRILDAEDGLRVYDELEVAIGDLLDTLQELRAPEDDGTEMRAEDDEDGPHGVVFDDN